MSYLDRKTFSWLLNMEWLTQGNCPDTDIYNEVLSFSANLLGGALRALRVQYFVQQVFG